MIASSHLARSSWIEPNLQKKGGQEEDEDEKAVY
jgi:hypothetical protein